MGASTSNLRRIVKEEFTRLRKDRDYLVLDNLLEFQLSLSGWRLDPTHVGVLLAIDRDRDGKFQLTELWDFALHVHKIASGIQSYELQSAVHGTFMLDLWRMTSTDDGLADIVDWLLVTVMENYSAPGSEFGLDGQTAIVESVADTRITGISGLSNIDLRAPLDDRPRTFAKHPDVTYLHKNSLHALHRILGHHGARAHDMDTFINTLQRAAEERDLLELCEPSLDDWVPQPVVRDYVEEVLRNMRQLVSDMDVLQILLHEDQAA